MKLVLAALALTTNWLNEHPECAVAAWLSSGVTEEADYRGDPALSQLYDKACMAMKDPSYDDITTEYKNGRGLWSTDTVVFLLDQVEDALATAADPAKHADIKTALGDIPWLSEAASESRKRWLAKSLADQEATKKAKHEEAPAAAQEGPEGRKKKTQELVAEAAAKLKVERAAKEEKEETRRHELMRDAAVEHIRKEFPGKKHKPPPKSVLDRLEKACRCSRKMAPGVHSDGCWLHPEKIRAHLQRHADNRAKIEAQLKSRIPSLDPQQRLDALNLWFGPAVALPGASAASSSSSSAQTKKVAPTSAASSSGSKGSGN